MRPQLQPGINFGSNLGFKRLTQWAPTLGIWGGVAGLSLLYTVEKIPFIRQDLLQNIPLVGGHWAKLVQESQAEQ